MKERQQNSCRLCENRTCFDYILNTPGLGVARCRQCGLVFEVSRGEKEEPEYDNIYPPAPPGGKPTRAERRRYHDWERDLTVSPGKQILEVGCSYGFFVAYLGERGWTGEGIDVSAHAVAYARSRGLNCRCAGIDDFQTEKKYDAVVLVHVLEHLPQPVAALQTIKNWLKPEGLVYLRVPNFASGLVGLSRADTIGHLKPHEHLSYFTPDTLKRALSEAGFGSRVWTEGKNSLADLINGRLRRRLVLSQKWRDYNYGTPSGEKNLYTCFKTAYERCFLPTLGSIRWGRNDREIVAIGEMSKDNKT